MSPRLIPVAPAPRPEPRHDLDQPHHLKTLSSLAHKLEKKYNDQAYIIRRIRERNSSLAAENFELKKRVEELLKRLAAAPGAVARPSETPDDRSKVVEGPETAQLARRTSPTASPAGADRAPTASARPRVISPPKETSDSPQERAPVWRRPHGQDGKPSRLVRRSLSASSRQQAAPPKAAVSSYVPMASGAVSPVRVLGTSPIPPGPRRAARSVLAAPLPPGPTCLASPTTSTAAAQHAPPWVEVARTYVSPPLPTRGSGSPQPARPSRSAACLDDDWGVLGVEGGVTKDVGDVSSGKR